MSDKNDDIGAFFLGVLFGGLAGAVAALLFAPQSGEETRAVIRDKAIELKEKASETLGETLTQAEKTANEAVKKAEIALKTAQTKTSQVAQKGHIILGEKITEKKPKADKAT